MFVNTQSLSLRDDLAHDEPYETLINEIIVSAFS